MRPPLFWVDGWRDGKVVSIVRLPLPVAIRHAREATAACERTVFRVREEQLALPLTATSRRAPTSQSPAEATDA